MERHTLSYVSGDCLDRIPDSPDDDCDESPPSRTQSHYYVTVLLHKDCRVMSDTRLNVIGVGVVSGVERCQPYSCGWESDYSPRVQQ